MPVQGLTDTLEQRVHFPVDRFQFPKPGDRRNVTLRRGFGDELTPVLVTGASEIPGRSPASLVPVEMCELSELSELSPRDFCKI